MLKFIVKRVFEALPTLFCVATLSFFLIRLAPGGPFSSERSVSPEVLLRLEQHYGLDKPLLRQYLDYMGNLFRGDLGPSFKYPNRTVNEIIAKAFPVSLSLGGLALLFALGFGLLAGILAASRPNCPRDYLCMSVAMVGICVPSFVLGPMLIWLFGLQLGWFNVSGWEGPGDWILPSITLGAIYAANIARLSRGSMIETLSKDFVRTARAKGLAPARILLVHALRGALLPVVSYLGPAAAGIVTGSFVVETIFQIPGLGRFFVTAAFNRDYTMIMGLVVFYAFLIVLFNTVVDVALVFLDPARAFEE